MVRFDTIIFRRTYEELFWSVRVDRKKVTIIVAFHFMKRQLKIAETYVEKKQITEIERRPKMFHQRQSVKNTGTNSV